VLFVNVQFFKVGEEWQYIPPPSKALPFVTVNPSNTESLPSPLAIVTTLPAWFPSIIVVAGPFSLFNVIALPLKFMFST
jgi:hypothetical protein